MPQGSSAWVWMSIATTSSISGSLSLAICGSRRLDFLASVNGLYYITNSARRQEKIAERSRKSREGGMAQAEAFETDFWKDANLRKVWDDIVPGEPRKTIPYTLTKEAIELYCKSVGEDH